MMAPTRDDCLNSYNIARRCDVVFAEVLRPEEGRQLPFAHTVVTHTDQHYIYLRQDLELRAGDTIFCKIDFIDVLFERLAGARHLSGLKLVTHQGATPWISEAIFAKKPACIAKWYAINVAYEHPDLIPIPLGLGCDYCRITIKIDDLRQPRPACTGPKKLLYVNHEPQTNPAARGWAYDEWSTNAWRTVERPTLSAAGYVRQLDRHEFLLAPWGRGVDTHRLWEALHHGIIPISEQHTTYRTLDGLPALLVDSLREQLSAEFLRQRLHAFRGRAWRYEKLSADWWCDIIKRGATP